MAATIEELPDKNRFEKRLENVFGDVLFEDKGNCDLFLTQVFSFLGIKTNFFRQDNWGERIQSVAEQGGLTESQAARGAQVLLRQSPETGREARSTEKRSGGSKGRYFGEWGTAAQGREKGRDRTRP